MKLTDKLNTITGIGDALSQKFASIEVHTIGDLINYYPRRYDDYSVVSKIKDLRPGAISIKAEIKQVKGRHVRRGMHITEAVASDDTDSVRLVWFNQPYRANYFKSGQIYYISGNYELSHGHFQIMSPSTEAYSDMPTNTARVLSVYPETKDIDSRQIRKAMIGALPAIESYKENLPRFVIKENDLISKSQALRKLHLPDQTIDVDKAKRRLGFEEVFEFSLASLLNKQENQTEKAVKIKFNEKLAKAFVASLPFKLTDSQKVATWRVYQDMEKGLPMNRLIEGDVGSGKTVVATMAALMVLKDKKQVALMAPTEILARQHGQTIYKLLEPLNMQDQVVLLVGSMNAKQKKAASEAIKTGKAGFIVGTHALIQEGIDMKNLALVVVDEQHRFGVKQREALLAKAGHMPHLLSLSATPIPRSLALTLYGELDITRLKEKPAGRQEIKTRIVYPSEKPALNKEIEAAIKNGRQIFIVCPSINESEMMEMNAATKVYEDLKKTTFKKYRLGLLHGQLKGDDKQAAMNEFVKGNTDILVATTVIEVGVDIPNATIMVVMSPERFGLAQLHQLRGRIGRGEHQGFFYMQLDNNEAPLKRLRALERSSDGFDLAELDLTLRGPGAIYGTFQHGALDLRIANLGDRALIRDAVTAAHEFIDRNEVLSKYAILNKNIKKLRSVTNLN
jgi:ATP-dependent DNA helicase RecG